MGRNKLHRPTKSCLNCGKLFQPRSDYAGKYCSRNCSLAHRIGPYAANWQGGKIEKQCLHCGKSVFLQPYRAAGFKYCSNRCKARNHTGRQGFHWQGDLIAIACPVCDKQFQFRRAEMNRRRYCSRRCHSIARTKRTDIPCPTCGHIRSLRDSEIARGRVFCGMRCFRLHRPTSIELAVQSKLTSLKIVFTPEHRIGRWSIDIFIPSANLAIECDGEYWHKRTRDIQRDQYKEDFLLRHGIRVLRLSENEIKNNLDTCIAKILSLKEIAIQT